MHRMCMDVHHDAICKHLQTEDCMWRSRHNFQGVLLHMRSTVAGQLHRNVDLHWHNYGGDAHLGKKTHVLLVANTPGVLWDLQRHRNLMETLENGSSKSDESVALHQKDVFLSLTFQWPRGFSQTRNPIEKWRFIAGEIINGGSSQGKSSINDG